jgi:hypothetical protein
MDTTTDTERIPRIIHLIRTRTGMPEYADCSKTGAISRNYVNTARKIRGLRHLTGQIESEQESGRVDIPGISAQFDRVFFSPEAAPRELHAGHESGNMPGNTSFPSVDPRKRIM